MTIQELFLCSNQALLRVVEQIKDDQWSLNLPEGVSRQLTTLDQAIRYHTYDDAWVPDVLAGKTASEVGDIYEPLLAGKTIKANYEKYNATASAAVQHYTDLERVVHLSYGDFPANEYLQHIVSFRAFRSYDLAKLLGLETKMDEDFVVALIDEFKPVIEDYRQLGVFPPALDAPIDATPQQQLMAMVGRE